MAKVEDLEGNHVSQETDSLKSVASNRVHNAGEAENAAGEKKAKKEPPPPSVPFHKLFKYADSFDYLLMFIGTLGAIVHGSGLPVFFVFFGKLIDAMGSGSLGKVDDFVLALLYIGIVLWLSSWTEVACWMHTGERQSSRVRSLYLSATLSQEIAYFDCNTSSGEMVQQISGDVLLLQDAISEKVGNFLHFMATFVSGFIVGFSTLWQLSLLILGIVPVIATCGAVMTVVITGAASQEQQAYSKAGIVAEQAISQIRTVYSFTAERRVLRDYSKAMESTLALGIKSGLAKGMGMGSVYGLLFCAWSLEFYYASYLVTWNIANGGKALTTIFAVLIGGLSLGQAMPNVTAFAKGMAAAYKIFATIERKPLIDSGSDDQSGEVLASVKGDIELVQVHFAYPARPDVPIFQGFSLSIPAGCTVALVGSSGSGKSTIISLIERFYDPSQGQVLVDGRDIRELRLSWLRGRMGLVSQEPALFATTIKDNILYGKQDATMSEVEEAAKSSNAHDFISSFPEKYDTQVGDHGVQMSGGQKQRIAIARAILKNPAILLLDEATSALDAESERVVQSALDNIMGGRTTIIVAHRLSTIRNADTIAVVAGGRIVESGTHDELIARDAAYASLVKAQTAAADAGAGQGGESTTQLAKKSGVKASGSGLGGAHKSSSAGIASHSNLSNASDTEKELNKDLEERDDREKEAGKKGSWGRLFSLSLPQLSNTLLGTVGAAGAGAINPFFGLFLTTVVVCYYYTDHHKLHEEVDKWSIVFVCLGFVSFVVYTLQHYNFGITGEHLTKRVREMMLAAFLRNEVGYYDRDRNSSGAVAARLSSDATLVKAAITDRISILFQNSALVIIAFSIGYALNWRMALVTTATFPLLLFSAFGEHAFMKGFAGDQEKAHEKASQIASEAVSNIRTVCAFSAKDKILSLFEAQLDGPMRRSFVRGQVSGFAYGFSQLCMYGAMALTLWYGANLIPKYATFGDVFKVFMVLIMTSFAIAEAMTLTPDIAKGGIAVTSVFSVIDRSPEIDPDENLENADVADGQDPILSAPKAQGDIELRNVKFAYPTRPDVILFRNFSLKIEAGKTVALVGPSGSGKSSVVSLIERFYDPLSGSVLVDGKDVRLWNVRQLRRNIGLVSQEPALFAMSIRDNILFGAENASEVELIEAAKAANAHNFISALPQGYDTQVGERGTQLSGGQKQRIAIARAVLKNPAILLLDEATSALDTESERIVQAALDGLMVNRTTVVIAHRLSTIRSADLIAVVQEGVICEKGTHEELYAREGGAYHSLVSLQHSTGGAAI